MHACARLWGVDILRAVGEKTDMGFVVVEVVSTPNPNAVKFVLDRPVAERPVSFLTADALVGKQAEHPVSKSGLVARLFAIPGVSSLLFLNDFVTVNKRPEAKWPGLKRAVKKALAED